MRRRSVLWFLFTVIHFFVAVTVLLLIAQLVRLPPRTVDIVVTASPLWGLLWAILYVRWHSWYNMRCYHRLYRANQCQHCGYDLFGNRSGRCPECGTERPFSPWRV